MKISVIIPHCPSEYHDGLLKRCLDSLPGDFERVIVVNEINTIGFTKAVNYGLRVATGDFLMVVNNDIMWKKGKLEDLCDLQAVTSPTLNGNEQRFWGCFFVIPRAIYEKIGELDERFYLYWSDTDYVKRLQEAGVPYYAKKGCDVDTEGGRTTKFMPGRKDHSTQDGIKFKEKWGVDRIEI